MAEVKIAVVGAGCAGSYFGYLASKAGFDVCIFDHSHPREKPCGGAVPARNFEKFAILNELDFPRRKVERAKIVMSNREVVLDLPEPVYIVDRASFDSAILSKAIEFGARHVKEKVKDIIKKDNKWVINGEHRFDVLVGADGVKSLVRKQLLGAQEPEHFGFSYYTKLDSSFEDELELFFSPRLAGYGWVFPRPAGAVCGVYFIRSSHCERAKKLLFEFLNPLIEGGEKLVPSLHPIPCIKRGMYSLIIASHSWALIGDSAMLADPYTGEGIFNALRSSELLFEAIKAGDLRIYQQRVHQEVLPDLILASRMLGKLYLPAFLRVVGWLMARSAKAKALASEFLSRAIDYKSFRERCIKTAFAMLKESLF